MTGAVVTLSVPKGEDEEVQLVGHASAMVRQWFGKLTMTGAVVTLSLPKGALVK